MDATGYEWVAFRHVASDPADRHQLRRDPLWSVRWHGAPSGRRRPPSARRRRPGRDRLVRVGRDRRPCGRRGGGRPVRAPSCRKGRPALTVRQAGDEAPRVSLRDRDDRRRRRSPPRPSPSATTSWSSSPAAIFRATAGCRSSSASTRWRSRPARASSSTEDRPTSLDGTSIRARGGTDGSASAFAFRARKSPL